MVSVKRAPDARAVHHLLANSLLLTAQLICCYILFAYETNIYSAINKHELGIWCCALELSVGRENNRDSA